MGVFLGNMVIANGGTVSSTVGGRLLRTVRSIAIHGPSALTGTATLQAADDVAESAFIPVQSGGSDVTITAVKTLTLTETPFGTLRIVSGSAEGAERTFPVWGEEKAHQ